MDILINNSIFHYLEGEVRLLKQSVGEIIYNINYKNIITYIPV